MQRVWCCCNCNDLGRRPSRQVESDTSCRWLADQTGRCSTPRKSASDRDTTEWLFFRVASTLEEEEEGGEKEKPAEVAKIGEFGGQDASQGSDVMREELDQEGKLLGQTWRSTLHGGPLAR